METTKITPKTNISAAFLWIIFLAMTFTACDMMEDDPDGKGKDNRVEAKEVYVVSGSSSVIDLNSVIQTDVPVRLAVTSSPSKGQLSDLGKGLFQYSPANPDARTRDAFAFTVFSLSDNNVLKKDSVIIHVEDDTTQLPCSIFPVDDYDTVSVVPVIIDVLANDVICGSDSAQLQLSIYKPDASFPPHVGAAQVVSNKIVYTPGNSFTGQDKIIYKIQAPQKPAVYGFVYLHRALPCQFQLKNDTLQVAMDTVTSAGVLLRVFDNDAWCTVGPSGLDLSISQPPPVGNATISAAGIRYWPAELLNDDIQRIDTIRYNVCNTTYCRDARVVVRITKD